MSDSLYVRDGNGILKELEVISGSTTSRFVPIHALTGSISTILSSTDLASLTGSISAVSSAIGTFNQQLYQALTGGPVSMSVDIVAGDVNTITGSVDKVTAETAKLTALSSSDGLKIYGNITSSISQEYATTVTTGSWAYTQITASAASWQATSAKTLTIVNQANSYLYITMNGANPTTSSYSIVLDPYSTYEVLKENARLQYKVLLNPSASVGQVVYTVTQ